MASSAITHKEKVKILIYRLLSFLLLGEIISLIGALTIRSWLVGGVALLLFLVPILENNS